jgi:NAD(P)-dependent dehydrogenase (short-subunit alcohol dehydrogenase family)
MTDFDGKVVLITGAGKGSGKALAKAFAAQGAMVAANDISPLNVEDLVDEINASGGKAKAYIEDVAKKVGVQVLVKDVEDDFGRIDILINHASVKPHSPLLEMDEWDWHRTLDVNLTGAFLMTQSVARVMREQGGGVIINLIAFEMEEMEADSDGGSMHAAFIASMAGLEAFSRQAARELAPHGTRVYAAKTTSKIEAIMDLCRG